MTGKRKFLFPPDLVSSRDTPTDSALFPAYFSVLLGSGDREHPFDSNVQNAFFMIKDRDKDLTQVGQENKTTVWIGGGALSGSASTSTNDPIVASGTASSTVFPVFDATNVAGVNDYGWKITFAAGEKNVGSAVTIAGTTFFNTNQPSSTAGGGACGSNLGIAREYLVSFADAGATTDLNALGSLSIANRSTIHAGGGYLPSPVPVVVEINGSKYQAVISGTSVQTPPGLTLDARLRTYWYRELDQ
jgi:type IV pilus assembly protein PilY1